MSLTPEQVADRVNFIGGSDAAAALGLSRWKSPLTLWAEKTGTVKREDIGDQLPVIVGTELESLVIKLFCDKTGKKVEKGTPATVTHPKHDFIRANPDALIAGEDAGLEAKTASGWKAKEWEGEEIPAEYKIQCLHNMAVTGKKTWYLACLIGGNQDFRWVQVNWDEKVISQMMEREVDFWKNYVAPKVMPTTAHRDDDDVLFKMFPEGNDPDTLELGDAANKIADSILALQTDRAVLEGFIKKEKNALKAMLGDHAIAETNRYRITWKKQTTRRFKPDLAKVENWEFYDKCCEDSPSRTLRIKTKKSKEKGK